MSQVQRGVGRYCLVALYIFVTTVFLMVFSCPGFANQSLSYYLPSGSKTIAGYQSDGAPYCRQFEGQEDIIVFDDGKVLNPMWKANFHSKMVQNGSTFFDTSTMDLGNDIFANSRRSIDLAIRRNFLQDPGPIKQNQARAMVARLRDILLKSLSQVSNDSSILAKVKARVEGLVGDLEFSSGSEKQCSFISPTQAIDIRFFGGRRIIRICPQFLNLPPEAMLAVLAHEVGHSIEPCFSPWGETPEVKGYPFPKLLTCSDMDTPSPETESGQEILNLLDLASKEVGIESPTFQKRFSCGKKSIEKRADEVGAFLLNEFLKSLRHERLAPPFPQDFPRKSKEQQILWAQLFALCRDRNLGSILYPDPIERFKTYLKYPETSKYFIAQPLEGGECRNWHAPVQSNPAPGSEGFPKVVE